MEQDTQKSNPRFNVASQAASSPPSADNSIAMVVDMGVGNLTDEDADKFLTHLEQSLTALRGAGVPVVWVTMSNRNHLHPPANPEGPAVSMVEGEDYSRVTKMHIGPAEMNSEFKNERFKRFIRDYGPKTNEAVYEKKCEGAFVETEDYAGNDDRTRILAGHLPRNKQTGEEIQVEGDTGGLTKYVRDSGAENILVMGAFSTHCDTETALSGFKKGFRTWLCLDNVLSWTKPEDEWKRPTAASRAVWRGDGVSDDYHRTKISARLDAIAQSEKEKEVRNLSDGDIEAVRNNFTTVHGFLGSLARRVMGSRPTQQPALNNV